VIRVARIRPRNRPICRLE